MPAPCSAPIQGTGSGQIFSRRFLDAHAIAVAVATSNGLFAYHRTTDAELSMTARTPDGTGSGWASAGSRDWGAVDPAALGRVAARKAQASRNPQTIEPRPYTAVLEPQAVNDLVPLLASALNARNADEGRSAFSKAGGGTRIGEQVCDERVTLYTDPSDPDLLGMPFDVEGLPIRRTVWIEKGVLRNLVVHAVLGTEAGRAADWRADLQRGVGVFGRRAEADRRHENHR